MKIAIIAAVAENGVIGRDGDLPWHLPADLKYFKSVTSGHPIIMGRRTFESFGGRPLPKRRNLIVSRNPDYAVAGVEVFPSLTAALHACADMDEVFICGGAAIYRESLAVADALYLTRIQAKVDGDTCFPDVDWQEWELVNETRQPIDARHAYALAFQHYRRR